MVQTNRSLLKYILFTIVTLGLYGFWFIYKLAQDINIICKEDGKNTAGLLKFIVFTMITCGIYAWFWYYGVGNRLAENASRYNLTFSENGTTVLLWMLFGSMLCGIGIFVALHIIIKNTNALATAYNAAH